ncbi:MAG: alkaline phosphatase D family protein [Gammaproteobacteria bacterium]|nr:alkaline phosphatase D family protein [Gammaproteobacteria bacterium]MBU2058967.1 alkaline phosphatase D family protein [Gammaproteobacteria bacterium]MBU2175044.1 alkaline phosphatase D family protein [Gammaproteobacteria bacterium]MBU2246727.1 alkaline phosphatase D family protein [Gammaproteobacteria bacterium]MBU2345913.1 alkaline phosphatase D family protein [Gammaproteobacteria bacterium]
MSNFSRRNFLKNSAFFTGAAWLSTAVFGCSSSVKTAKNTSPIQFLHGVASGDPLTDSLILWTKVTTEQEPDSVQLLLEVSASADFSVVQHQQLCLARKEADYSCKVDLTGLLPGRSYYYRFSDSRTMSAVGHAKTLPAGSVSQVRFAVLSCSNYPAGYFHVYQQVAQQQLDAVLHLGDYIYEYEQGGYATERSVELGRALAADNLGEIISLTDYRNRYALYRSDKDLQQAHASHSFICVWDDHEITNDAWTEGAENHQPNEGDYQQRKLNALQAYYEWMPIRPVVVGQQQSLCRSFSFGDLVDLHMLDTRVEGRNQQLEYKHYTDEKTGAFDTQRFIGDLTHPNRTLLGQKQQQWLQTQLMRSKAHYQVLGQQVLMAKMMFPSELLSAFSKPGPELVKQIAELSALKQRAQQGDSSLSTQDRQRIESVVAYNLDAWDGYPYERELIYQTAQQQNKQLVVLAGDTHNAWASTLHDQQGKKVGIELATASVSSPGIETYLKLNTTQVEQLAGVLPTLIDELEYCNLHQRGYLLVSFSKEQIDAQWFFVDDITKAQYQTILGHQKSYKL